MLYQAERLIPAFNDAVEGNWRNSFYIECTGCRWDRETGCGDFLFVPDLSGKPLLLPLSLIERHYGRIDKSECLGRISNLMFYELFHRYLTQANIISSSALCPLLSVNLHQKFY